MDPETFTDTSCLISYHIGTPDNFSDKILAAISQMHETPTDVRTVSHGITDQLPDLEYEIPMRDCFVRDCEEIPIESAVGRISLSLESPCPPGCIVLDIGQRIVEKHLKFFKPTDLVWVIKQTASADRVEGASAYL